MERGEESGCGPHEGVGGHAVEGLVLLKARSDKSSRNERGVED